MARLPLELPSHCKPSVGVQRASAVGNLRVRMGGEGGQVSAKRVPSLTEPKTTDRGENAQVVGKSQENLVALGAAPLINKAGFP